MNFLDYLPKILPLQEPLRAYKEAIATKQTENWLHDQ